MSKGKRKKRTEAADTINQAVSEPAATPPPYAPLDPQPIRNDTRNLYGATENRRTCHACGSANSTVTSVRRMTRLTIRYRVCSDCKTRRTTQEVLSM